MAYEARVVFVHPLSASDVGDGGNDLSRQPIAFGNLVPGDLVHHQPKERNECVGVETYLGYRWLSDSLDLVA